MTRHQAQYIDIYDSVLENIVCGETKLDADASLRMALKKLRTVDRNTGETELEKQFRVRMYAKTTLSTKHNALNSSYYCLYD